MRWMVLPAVVGAALFGQTKVAAQPGTDLKAVLVREAPRKWKEYRAFAKGLQGTARLTSSRMQPFVLKMVRTDSMKQAPGAALYLWGQSNVLGGDKAFAPKGSKVWGQNPKYSFELARADESEKWAVAGLALGGDKILKQVEAPVSEFVERSFNLHFFGHCLRPIADLLTDKSFTVKSVHEEIAMGRKLVHVDFEYTEPLKQGTRRTSGWMKMDPEKYWCITETVTDVTDPQYSGSVRSVFETVEGRSGFPVLRHVEHRQEGHNTKKRYHLNESSVDFVLQENTAVPEREFTLSAFGLPEPMEGNDAAAPRYYLWFFAIGAGFFALAGACQFLKRRGAVAAVS